MTSQIEEESSVDSFKLEMDMASNGPQSSFNKELNKARSRVKINTPATATFTPNPPVLKKVGFSFSIPLSSLLSPPSYYSFVFLAQTHSQSSITHKGFVKEKTPQLNG